MWLGNVIPVAAFRGDPRPLLYETESVLKKAMRVALGVKQKEMMGREQMINKEKEEEAKEVEQHPEPKRWIMERRKRENSLEEKDDSRNDPIVGGEMTVVR